MCGKFTQMASWRQVWEYSNLFAAKANDEAKTYTPASVVPVVHLDVNGDRIVSPMVWGYSDRSAEGRRALKLMHARGETVHEKRAFRDAFERRRGIAFAKTFNEGKEIPIVYDDGTPTGKMWTQQWFVRQKEGRPAIFGVIYDVFEAGRGPEYEFVQITVPPNEMLAAITDRMPLLLGDEDVSLWLGEWRAPIEEVMALIRTRQFGADWEIAVENPSKRPPTPRRPKSKVPAPEPDLFL